jgi:hypothetical protein
MARACSSWLFVAGSYSTLQVLVPLVIGLGCAAASERRVESDVDYGLEERGVWVRGPWEQIRPSADIDDVIDQLCPAVMGLPDARGHDFGVEYCGLLYLGADGQYHSSAPSPLAAPGESQPSLSKSCRVPRRVSDPAGVRNVESDFHSHPWPDSPLSPRRDTATRNQRYSIRIQFDTTCRLMKFVPHINEPVPAELFERVGRSWRLLRVIPVHDKASGNIDPPIEVP